MEKQITAKMPWKENTGGVPLVLDYFEGSMYEKVAGIAKKYPGYTAFDFQGRSTSYGEMLANINRCAKALRAIGIRENDKVTIIMPNCPQAIYMFYALNAVGAIANMVHPLSAEKEIEFYIEKSHSVAAITLDQFYYKLEKVRKNVKLNTLIIASIRDELPALTKAGYDLTLGRKIKKLPENAPVLMWKEFLKLSSVSESEFSVSRKSDDPAVILYSGGTTGKNKGIVLTNKNFNALSQQITATNPMFLPGDKMLAAMPIFHGFGLGVCIHSMLASGGRCLLLPKVNPKEYAKMLTKYKCNFFSGGDSLSIELKKKFDKFLAAHGAVVQVREGYGTTETVTACCLTPIHKSKEGSIGVPFPDTYIKIVRPGTDEELPYGDEGEILLAGPTVMKEYLDEPEETANTLRTHSDGLTWVYTGDLGTMDEEGFVYFKGRAKRMIISSGFNVYPAQVENILDSHEKVQMSCVIGIPDPVAIQVVKAFVMLKPGVVESDDVKTELIEYCKKHVFRYAVPREVEFRDELPKTLVGKVAYRALEEEEAAKRAKAES